MLFKIGCSTNKPDKNCNSILCHSFYINVSIRLFFFANFNILYLAVDMIFQDENILQAKSLYLLTLFYIVIINREIASSDQKEWDYQHIYHVLIPWCCSHNCLSFQKQSHFLNHLLTICGKEEVTIDKPYGPLY